MADTVRNLMELMVPELEDYERRGYFSRGESAAIVQRRQHFEYALKRRNTVKQDFLRYAEYEWKLEQLRRLRRKERGITGKKSLADYGIVRRIHFVYERATRKFKGDLGMWTSWLKFCKDSHSSRQVSKVVTKALKIHPNSAFLWTYAAAWEYENNGNAIAARLLMQSGLQNCPASAALWLEYFRMELLYANKLIARRKVLGLDDASSEAAPSADTMILAGQLAKLVYNQAIVQCPRDAALRRRCLQIASTIPCNGTDALRTHIADSMLADFAEDPERLCELASCVHDGLTGAAKAGPAAARALLSTALQQRPSRHLQAAVVSYAVQRVRELDAHSQPPSDDASADAPHATFAAAECAEVLAFLEQACCQQVPREPASGRASATAGTTQSGHGDEAVTGRRATAAGSASDSARRGRSGVGIDGVSGVSDGTGGGVSGVSDPAVHVAHCEALLRCGRTEEARRVASEALRCNPQSWQLATQALECAAVAAAASALCDDAPASRTTSGKTPTSGKAQVSGGKASSRSVSANGSSAAAGVDRDACDLLGRADGDAGGLLGQAAAAERGQGLRALVVSVLAGVAVEAVWRVWGPATALLLAHGVDIGPVRGSVVAALRVPQLRNAEGLPAALAAVFAAVRHARGAEEANQLAHAIEALPSAGVEYWHLRLALACADAEYQSACAGLCSGQQAADVRARGGGVDAIFERAVAAHGGTDTKLWLMWVSHRTKMQLDTGHISWRATRELHGGLADEFVTLCQDS